MSADWAGLLGRPEITYDADALAETIAGRTVLVTGAGGSVGGELTRRLAALDPEHLILFDSHEASLVRLRPTIEGVGRRVRVRYVLGDLRDPLKVAQVFRRHAVDLVFHLAAYKQVPLAEDNVDQVFAVNVIGTANLLERALDGPTRAIVFPSTDKVVNLAGIYSCTKRIVEHLARAVPPSGSALTLRAGRLVNVVDSQGNVVETFSRQIQTGQPLTVTDPAMDRYWITSAEALGFLLAVAGQPRGGVYMIEPGEAIPVVELARRLYRRLRPEDAAGPSLVVTGARPGERLHEQLQDPDETRRPTSHARIFGLDTPAPEVALAAWLHEIGELRRRLYDWEPADLRAHVFTLARAGRPTFRLASDGAPG